MVPRAEAWSQGVVSGRGLSTWSQGVVPVRGLSTWPRRRLRRPGLPPRCRSSCRCNRSPVEWEEVRDGVVLLIVSLLVGKRSPNDHQLILTSSTSSSSNSSSKSSSSSPSPVFFVLGFSSSDFSSSAPSFFSSSWRNAEHEHHMLEAIHQNHRLMTSVRPAWVLGGCAPYKIQFRVSFHNRNVDICEVKIETCL